jgi:hypothetical protein
LCDNNFFRFLKPTNLLVSIRYHIPREWLHESDNLLVLFEETGGDPSKISLEVHYTKAICSRISENYYPPLSAWSHLTSGHVSVDTVAPELHLQCDDGHVISQIKFASYGTPSGDCQNFSKGKCHSSSTLDLVSEVSLQVSTAKPSNCMLILCIFLVSHTHVHLS